MKHILKSTKLIFATALINISMFMLLGFYSGLFDSLGAILFREISFIISPYAPNANEIIPLYLIYILSLIIFSLTVNSRVNTLSSSFGTLFLLLASLVAILLIWFPMDPPGMITGQGVRHIYTGLVMVLFLVLSMFFYALAFKQTGKLLWLYKYTMFISIFLALSGLVITILAKMNLSAYVGLAEKLPLLVFLLWIPLTTIGLTKLNES